MSCKLPLWPPAASADEIRTCPESLPIELPDNMETSPPFPSVAFPARRFRDPPLVLESFEAVRPATILMLPPLPPEFVVIVPPRRFTAPAMLEAALSPAAKVTFAPLAVPKFSPAMNSIPPDSNVDCVFPVSNLIDPEFLALEEPVLKEIDPEASATSSVDK